MEITFNLQPLCVALIVISLFLSCFSLIWMIAIFVEYRGLINPKKWITIASVIFLVSIAVLISSSTVCNSLYKKQLDLMNPMWHDLYKNTSKFESDFMQLVYIENSLKANQYPKEDIKNIALFFDLFSRESTGRLSELLAPYAQ